MSMFPTDNASLRQRDLAHVWHPCTQMKDHEWLPLIPIRRGQGVWLEDFDGNRYLDAVSSWWVNLFGHANPRINGAIKAQVDNLEQVILAGFTHEPVIRLAEQLAAITPAGLERSFFADNGSSAVEVALKMSFHYWRNQGETGKTRYVNLSNSYHGETFGALAVGDVGLYKDIYQPLLLEPLTAPSPDSYLRTDGESEEDCARRAFAGMEKLLEKHAGEVCAIILEPLVQCAGYMRMYHPVYLDLVRDACNRHGVHLIADEIAVGFGRTGTLFGCNQANDGNGISPDFMCLSKGLTGGYLPLSAVVTTDEIYQSFYDDYDNIDRAFLHSHSYTGNPLGCSAALATLEIFKQDDVIERNREKARYLSEALNPLREHPHVADVRQTGMIAAVEMTPDGSRQTSYDWQERRGLKVYQDALQRGVLLRPLGNVVYFMPPYIIGADEIDRMVDVAIEGINAATAE